MTALNPTPSARPRQSAPPTPGNLDLRPDLAAFFVLGSRKIAHAGQHREFGVLAELRAQFGRE